MNWGLGWCVFVMIRYIDWQVWYFLLMKGCGIMQILLEFIIVLII